ncbi:MAG TPA: hypothetical protein VF929_05490 [Gemmatimonadaceae bacterium]
MTRALVARAPTRLDFAGGWTDVPPYSEREGGAVCNIAITRYATATVSQGANAGSPSPAFDDDALVQAAIRRSSLSGVDAHVASDFPIGAGLGGSSAAGVALAGALAVLGGAALEPHALALRSRETEVEELRVPGGVQDHFAAAFGGALLLRITDTVDVERIPLSVELRADIARRGVLLYTGESRLSGSTITAVRDDYLAGVPRVVKALARTRELAVEMANALRAADIDALGSLLGEQWVHQRALHPSITTPRIDAIVDIAGPSGALGVKALGASGGGCVLAIARDGREDELAHALSSYGDRMTWDVDVAGFDVIASLTDSATPRDDD